MSEPKKKQRLSGAAYRQLLEDLRRAVPAHVRELVAKVVWDRNWYFEKFHEKEEELRRLVQADLFEKQKAQFENGPPKLAPAPPPARMQRGERIWNIFHEGEEAVARLVRFTPGSDRDALRAEANAWAIINERDTIA